MIRILSIAIAGATLTACTQSQPLAVQPLALSQPTTTTPATSQPNGKKRSYSLTNAEKEAAKRLVAAELKDPFSAVIEISHGFKNTGTGYKFACGRVNGKNSYGAYIGFKKFAIMGVDSPAADRSVLIGADSDDATERFNRDMIAIICRKRA